MAKHKIEAMKPVLAAIAGFNIVLVLSVLFAATSCNEPLPPPPTPNIVEYSLSIQLTGNGSVAKNPDSPKYVENSTVELTATADDGWVFIRWEGDATGDTNPITLAMDGDKTVTALFIQNYSISGKVTDRVTGAPISGASLRYGEHSLATDSQGNYAVNFREVVTSSLGSKDAILIPGVQNVTGIFSVHKGLSYMFVLADGINIDPTTNPVYNIRLLPMDPSEYQEVIITGRAYDSSGNEIGTNSRINFIIVNELGGVSKVESSAYDSSDGGYSVSTKTFGFDCFIHVSYGGKSFYVQNKDLSGQTTVIDLVIPQASSFTSVTISGSESSSYECVLMVPNYLPIPKYGFATIGGGSTQGTTSIYNPDGYPLLWVQKTSATVDEIDIQTGVMSDLWQFSPTATMPVLPTRTGPDTSVDAVTATYSNGVFSFTGVNSANLYAAVLAEGAGSYGYILSSGESIDFPAEFISSVITAGSVWHLITLQAMSISVGVDPMSFVPCADPPTAPIFPSWDYIAKWGPDDSRTDIIP